MLQRRSTDELHARLVKTLAAKGDGHGVEKYVLGLMCFVLSYASENAIQRIATKIGDATKASQINYEFYTRAKCGHARVGEAAILPLPHALGALNPARLSHASVGTLRGLYLPMVVPCDRSSP